LRRAHVILWTGDLPPSGDERAELGGAAVYELRRRVIGFRDRDGEPCEAPAKVCVLSGIAQPERFHADVAERTAVLGVRSFADHHAFAQHELEEVFAESHSLGADAVVTTEKDAARLLDVPDRPPLRVLRVEAIVGEAAFREDVLRVAATV
jgi:tetraacyldisaccharide-1-P 4'-kinase